MLLLQQSLSARACICSNSSLPVCSARARQIGWRMWVYFFAWEHEKNTLRKASLRKASWPWSNMKLPMFHKFPICQNSFPQHEQFTIFISNKDPKGILENSKTGSFWMFEAFYNFDFVWNWIDSPASSLQESPKSLCLAMICRRSSSMVTVSNTLKVRPQLRQTLTRSA